MEQQIPDALVSSMGKEKKPFTYLPGGLDFSEIRSPKMAKRLAKHQAMIAKPDTRDSGPPKRNAAAVNNNLPVYGRVAPKPSGQPLPQQQQQQQQQQNESSRPTYQKQRSISDMLTGPSMASNWKNQNAQEPYNPYAAKSTPTTPSTPPVTQFNTTPSVPPVPKVPVIPQARIPPPPPPVFGAGSIIPPPPPPPPPAAEEEPLGFTLGKKPVSALVSNAKSSLNKEREEKLQHEFEEEEQKQRQEQREKEAEEMRRKEIEAEEEKSRLIDRDVPDQSQLFQEQQDFIRRQKEEAENMERENRKRWEEEYKRAQEEDERKRREQDEQMQRQRQRQQEEQERLRRDQEQLQQRRQQEEEQLQLQRQLQEEEQHQRRQREEEEMAIRQREEQERVKREAEEQERHRRQQQQQQLEEEEERRKMEERFRRQQSEERRRKTIKITIKANVEKPEQNGGDGFDLEPMDNNELVQEEIGIDNLHLNSAPEMDRQHSLEAAKQNRIAINVAMEKQRASLSPQPMAKPTLLPISPARAPSPKLSPTQMLMSEVAKLPPHPPPSSKQTHPKPKSNADQLIEVPVQRVSSPAELRELPHLQPQQPQSPLASTWNKPSPMQWGDYSSNSLNRKPQQIRRVAQTPPPIRSIPIHPPVQRAAATPPPMPTMQQPQQQQQQRQQQPDIFPTAPLGMPPMPDFVKAPFDMDLDWKEPLSPQSKCFTHMGTWNKANTSEVPRTVKPPTQSRTVPIRVEGATSNTVPRKQNPISRLPKARVTSDDIIGSRMNPPQSPSVTKLGLMYADFWPEEPVRESKAVSRGEYGGQEGRFMPPKQEQKQKTVNNFYQTQAPMPVQIGPGKATFHICPD